MILDAPNRAQDGSPQDDPCVILPRSVEPASITEPQVASEAETGFAPTGRLLALDLGTRRVGVAVCDERRVTVSPLPPLARQSWKKLVREIAELVERFDAKAVVVGLPLRLDGTEGDSAAEARRLARNLSLTLALPVRLQDERMTSRDAEGLMRETGLNSYEMAARVDSAAAAIILRDFITKPPAEEGHDSPRTTADI
jgi:putative Holliday junction resolvase